MNRIVRSIATLAAAVLGVGTLALGGSVASEAADPLAKREENINLVMTADDGDDDDDTNTNTGNTRSRSVNRDNSGVSRDGTNSRFTGVSRDRDVSRGDLTKDWTRDGGDRTRDHSRHQTNDSSRNDTR